MGGTRCSFLLLANFGCRRRCLRPLLFSARTVCKTDSKDVLMAFTSRGLTYSFLHRIYLKPFMVTIVSDCTPYESISLLEKATVNAPRRWFSRWVHWANGIGKA